MAITQIHAIETTLTKAIDYISNPDKTDDKLLISGFNCTPEMAAYEFNFTKKIADRQGGRLAYHMIQSFAPGEVDYFTAHETGKQLADGLLNGNYEYIVATHCDKNHIHNHIIFNSVSFTHRKKFHGSADIFHRIRRISDKLCRENNLSVIEEPSGDKGKCYTEYNADKQGTSWKSALREAIDRCIKKARDWNEFLALMEAEKYEIKHGKHICFRRRAFADGKSEQQRFTRAKTLGNRYTEQSIKAQLSGTVKFILPAPVTRTERTGISLLIDIENSINAKKSAGYKYWAERNNLKMAAMTVNYLSDNGLLAYENLTAKHNEVKSRRDTVMSRIKVAEKRIKELNTQIKDIDTFRKNKPIVEKLDSVVFKDKYKREHQTEFILFDAAKQSLNAHFPDKKYPLIKTLRAELSELHKEKSKLYPEYYEAKDEYKTLSMIKDNTDSILGKTEQDRERKAREKNKNKGELD
jgi:hypothetical protein